MSDPPVPIAPAHSSLPPTPLSAPQIESWTLADGYSAHVRCWVPAVPRGAIVYLHGIQSHGGWYEWSGSVLAECGWVVVMPDRRGSGLNQAARGHVDQWRRWVEDVDTITRRARERFGAWRLGLVGVSWGGKLAAAAVCCGLPFERLLLVAPGLHARVQVPAGERLRVAWSLVTARGHRLHPIPLRDPALFTDSAAGRRFIEQDALKLTHVSARFMRESLRMDAWLARRAPVRGPVSAALLLAGADRIIDNARTAAWMRRAFASAQIEPMAGAAHTIEFEPDTSAFAHFLRRWAEIG